jgi:hypothetical protein
VVKLTLSGRGAVALQINGQLSTGLRILLAVEALFYLAAFVAVALGRLSYPFSLNWLEGATVEAARRIMSGQPLYAAPSLQYVPLIYTPLYFLLSGALMVVFGPGLVAPRLLSFICAIGCFVTIFLLVRLETGQAFIGLISAGLFAALYRVTGAWLDLARVDTLFVFLMLVAIYAARRFPGMRGAGISATAVLLAYATKQPALLLAAGLLVYYLLADRRAAVVFGLVSLIGGAAFHLFWSISSEGWFQFYTLEIPRKHAVSPDAFRLDYWAREAQRAPLLVIAAAISLVSMAKMSPSRALFYVPIAGALLVMSWAGRANSGGAANVLLPGAVGLVVLAGWWLGRIFQHRMAVLCTLGYLACAIQFAGLFYNPVSQVPTVADRDAGQKLLETIRSTEGEVYVPLHPYYAELAGKSSYAHWTAIADVSGLLYADSPASRAETDERRARIVEEVTQAIAGGQFAMIVIDETPARGVTRFWRDLLSQHQDQYARRSVLFSRNSANLFWTRAGMRTRPQYVYLRRDR